MEQPDDKGFINITWPSKTIPHGGIFHTKVAEPSIAQQELLRVQREECKLSIAQRQKGAYNLRQKDEKHEPETIERPLIRPRTSRRRSLSAIRDSGALEMDQYYPLKKGEDREKLKDNLAYKMAYGNEELPPTQVQHAPRIRPQYKLPTKKEQWNDLVTQIRERADWLAEMEILGHGGPHRELVQDQIAQRLRALDELGVDSICSSARSNVSGFSVLPSERSIQSKESSHTRRLKMSKSGDKTKQLQESGKKFTKEENVLAYEKFPPLRNSPRRRV